jgi:hypothetical protein
VPILQAGGNKMETKSIDQSVFNTWTREMVNIFAVLHVLFVVILVGSVIAMTLLNNRLSNKLTRLEHKVAVIQVELK